MSTRVKEPDKYEYYKLIRLIQYLKGTQDIRPRLRADNTNIIIGYIDADHAVHNDMRGSIGLTLQMVKCGIIIKYIKNKLKTKNCRESELVGIDNGMADVLLTKYVLEGQECVHKKQLSDNTTRARYC